MCESHKSTPRESPRSDRGDAAETPRLEAAEPGGVEPGFVDALANVDAEADPEPWLRMLRGMWAGHPDKDERYRQLFSWLRAPRGGRVLEIGCGAGGPIRLFARAAPGLRLAAGIDPSVLALKEARKLEVGDVDPSVAYLAADGRALPFAADAFDAVFCTRVLVHAPEPARILNEMVRVTRPGGRLLLVEPDRSGTLSSVDSDEVLRAFWSTRRSLNPRIGTRLLPLLVARGLRVERIEPHFTITRQPPLEDDVRMLERALKEQDGEYGDLVRAGLVTIEQLHAYVASLRSAHDSNAFLRTDLELVYLAEK